MPTWLDRQPDERARIAQVPCIFCAEATHSVVECRALRTAIRTKTVLASFKWPRGLLCAYCTFFGLVGNHDIARCTMLVEHMHYRKVPKVFVKYYKPKNLLLPVPTECPPVRPIPHRHDVVCGYCSVEGHDPKQCHELHTDVCAGCMRR
ncbi:hypothetical protein SPRG_02073 [Saprolegnia parasitica CBS 223.65]|uniref:Uncharacterized protein n=1 Tax=Saprolegnia parasitica (strain CBS 223.65) TaxID=695850 RepID=A0A067CRF3_SAPPC|nr:hypothetical protein SPRG_02073 [Saprolegnia parasitica CBS 223.65]KDO33264.1 hypothetical protein SPRG_02073 [Saprolegnia parasitica CBS 223.65]|eukprot:XP_012196020.1 hypothetical protein SPRG_02073 [Saprolegnia parasitica CBS 223.65]